MAASIIGSPHSGRYGAAVYAKSKRYGESYGITVDVVGNITDSTEEGLKTAADAVAIARTTFPGDTTLEARTWEARYYLQASNKAAVVTRYKAKPYNGSGGSLYWSRTTGFRTHFSHWYWNGSGWSQYVNQLYPGTAYPLIAQIWPVVTFTASVDVAISTINTQQLLAGRVNDAATTIDGMSVEKWSLRFNGIHEEPRIENGSRVSRATYSFSWCPIGWDEEIRVISMNGVLVPPVGGTTMVLPGTYFNNVIPATLPTP